MTSTFEGEEQERKLFVRGLHEDITEDILRDFFQNYGSVASVIIIRDEGYSRGFGFVVFQSSESLERVIDMKKHGEDFFISGHSVQVKRALPRSAQNNGVSSHSFFEDKVFVGGLPSVITEEDLYKYFQQYGVVKKVELLKDHVTGIPRGFGFIKFAEEDSVFKCLQTNIHKICSKVCEVRQAEIRAKPVSTNEFTSVRFSKDNRPVSNISINHVNILIQKAFFMGQQSALCSQSSAVGNSTINGRSPVFVASNSVLQPAVNRESFFPINPTNTFHNPLNPTNTLNPNNTFNPTNMCNPINMFNPINTFNPINMFNPAIHKSTAGAIATASIPSGNILQIAHAMHTSGFDVPTLLGAVGNSQQRR